jgi:hypothetical protein
MSDPHHVYSAALAAASPNAVTFVESEHARPAMAEDPTKDRVLPAGIAVVAQALCA